MSHAFDPKKNFCCLDSILIIRLLEFSLTKTMGFNQFLPPTQILSPQKKLDSINEKFYQNSLIKMTPFFKCLIFTNVSHNWELEFGRFYLLIYLNYPFDDVTTCSLT